MRVTSEDGKMMSFILFKSKVTKLLALNIILVYVFLEFKKKTQLHHVNIYFKSPTFDLITEDAKTNFVTKLSVVGGTLGLFAGFSLLSGAELICFLFSLVLALPLSLMTPRGRK